MPLMHERVRVERAFPRSPDILADRDLCVRAIFAASVPIRAQFKDPSGALRGPHAEGVTGTSPPEGPVCILKGETLHLELEPISSSSSQPAVEARAILFTSP